MNYFLPILANADNDPGSDPLQIGKWLLVFGALLWIVNQAVGLWQSLQTKKDEPAKIEQPVRTTTEHPCVDQPTFTDHKKEIWEVINGLRMAVSRIETAVSTSNALREANGDRLSELTTEFTDLRNSFHRLSGSVEHFMKEERKR